MSKIDELTIFEIVPYIGTNMVNFGATRAEVCDSMGAAERTSISFQGKLIEYRSYECCIYWQRGWSGGSYRLWASND